MELERAPYQGHECRCDMGIYGWSVEADAWVEVWHECHGWVKNPDSPFCRTCEDRHPGAPVRVRPMTTKGGEA